MRKSVKSAQKWKSALFAPKAENVALAQGIIGILGTHNAEMVKMVEFNQI